MAGEKHGYDFIADLLMSQRLARVVRSRKQQSQEIILSGQAPSATDHFFNESIECVHCLAKFPSVCGRQARRIDYEVRPAERRGRSAYQCEEHTAERTDPFGVMFVEAMKGVGCLRNQFAACHHVIPEQTRRESFETKVCHVAMDVACSSRADRRQ